MNNARETKNQDNTRGIVVITNLTARPVGGFSLNHAEGVIAPAGIVVETGITGGKKSWTGTIRF